MKPVALTLGDPNGISPEITIKALNSLNIDFNKLIVIGNSDIFEYYSDILGLKLKNNFEIIEIPFDINNLELGKETAYGGEFAYNTLFKACELAKSDKISSIVTAPLSKNAMHLAGHNFSGQTEVLEKFLAHSSQKAEMLFTADNFRILLLTRHVALSQLSQIITKDLIIDKIKRLNFSLKNNFKIKNPKIAICSLNPHASENGLFGNEENLAYIPAITELKQDNIDITGPFPSDGLFAQVDKENPCYDCYVASYHDQGLIPMKLLAGKYAVNTTIGLDIIRTSPAHGTAYDIAGKNLADCSSMISAIQSALSFAD